MKTINEEFHFEFGYVPDIKETFEALDAYKDLYAKALTLDKNVNLVFDTNILLGYYGMSNEEKTKLIRFIQANVNRIIITTQVEIEFLRNRLDVIQKDFFDPIDSLVGEYDKLRSKINNAYSEYVNSTKRILSQDYPKVYADIMQEQSQIKSILLDKSTVKNALQDKSSELVSNFKNIAIVDPLLEVLQGVKTFPKLSEDEIGFLKIKYDSYRVAYKEMTKPNEKEKLSFPGCGEKKGDPYGDFLIFHEFIKLLEDQPDEEFIFLTNDVTKSDWIKSDRNPFIHYIHEVYRLTGKPIVIIHGEPILNISFENIHKEIQYEEFIKQFKTEEGEYESNIVSIDHDKQYAFVYTPQDNLYFRSNEVVIGKFDNLDINSIVRFRIGENYKGEKVASQVKLKNYSFNGDSQVFESVVATITKEDKFGWIKSDPDDIFFHIHALEDINNFDSINVGTKVQYILGVNFNNEIIARNVKVMTDEEE